MLDLNCKAPDLDNLYVVGGSFFLGSSGGPTFTSMANALCVGGVTCTTDSGGSSEQSAHNLSYPDLLIQDATP